MCYRDRADYSNRTLNNYYYGTLQLYCTLMQLIWINLCTTTSINRPFWSRAPAFGFITTTTIGIHFVLNTQLTTILTCHHLYNIIFSYEVLEVETIFVTHLHTHTYIHTYLLYIITLNYGNINVGLQFRNSLLHICKLGYAFSIALILYVEHNNW